MPVSNLKVLPGKNFGKITQQELKDFYYMEQKFMDARNAWLAMQAKLILRMNSGATQEAGKFHIEKKVTHRRSISYKEIVVELRGQKFVDNLLAKTKPTTYTRLEFSDVGGNA